MKSVLELLTGSLANFITSILSIIMLAIDSIVYAVVGWAYDMFTIIAGARVLDESALRDLADRVYIIIGVVALFIVAYALLQAIIDPDKASKGDTSLGKIIPNIAIAICGIAIVPTIFNYAYDIQRMILCNNIIPKLLLDNSITYDDNGYYKSEKPGAEIATLLFESFFYPKNNDGGYANVSSEANYIQMLRETSGDFFGGDLGQAYEDAKEGAMFWPTFIKFIDDIAAGKVGYLIIISTIAGGYCAYVLITYCFDAAIRAVKLAYLEILAPLPLLLMIVPGQKKIFQNWLKKTLSCFFEIFIRIFAIVFVAFIMRHLPDLIFNMSSMFNNGYGCLTNPGFITMLLIRALLINALFAFMKQAPKLISEITGIDSKGFSIGLKGKGVLGDTLSTLGGTVTAAAGAGYFARKNGQDVVAAMKYGATKNLKDKGNGNQFGASARDYYKTILRNDNEPSLLTGKQKVNDKNLDDYRKSAQNGYVDYRKNRYEQDSTFKGFVNDYVNAAVQNERNNRQNNLNEAQRDYDDAMDRRNRIIQRANDDVSANESKLATLENELANYRNSKEYMQNLKAGQSTIENYQNQINEAKRVLDESRTRAEAAQHTYDPDMQAAESNLQKAREEYNKRIDPKDYQSAAIEQARARYANLTKDEINTLSNGDPGLGETIKQTQDDIKFVVKVENEKAGKDFVNSLEGQKAVQTNAAARKLTGDGTTVKTGEYGSGQNAGGADKPNGQK